VAPLLAGLPVLAIGHLPRVEMRAAICRDGAPGRAIIDKVRPGDPLPDGRALFYLGMWIQLDAGPSARHDDAPTPVEPSQAAKVVPGCTVPVRAALVDGISIEVLLWELLD
jgi:hypothetical protein